MITETLDRNPDLLALHRLNPQRYPFLLQSTLPSDRLGRYDILFAFPGEQLLHQQGDSPSFLDNLASRFDCTADNQQSSPGDSKLPFRGGWFLFLSYELAGEIENLPALAPDTDLPVAMATRIPAAIIYSHVDGKTTFVAESGNPESSSSLELFREDLSAIAQGKPAPVNIESLEEESPTQFLGAVNTAKHYIREGDIFQANLSRQWQARINKDATPADVYARLRQSNPSPFAGLVRIDDHTSVLSSSPERLLEVRGSQIRTRPIAGTHPRLEDARADEAQTKRLLTHPKERAEHIMLIDLERNDLGRVCVPGTVKVPELMVVESYRHVHHIVSEVAGLLRPGTTPSEVIAATFPGGTITGCPKVRCMEIISELEQGARGAYTGSMGYLNHDGSMDLNILIRTMTMTGNVLKFRAGAGIVADSVPERELAETRAKAEGMIRALRPG